MTELDTECEFTRFFCLFLHFAHMFPLNIPPYISWLSFIQKVADQVHHHSQQGEEVDKTHLSCPEKSCRQW